MKKLSTLLTRRQALLRQAHLANLAFAYTKLREFERRVTRAQLAGSVTLKHAAPQAERYWASLTAHEGNQSVIEEHFADEELMDLADVMAFITGHDSLDLTFRIEEVGEIFLGPIQAELARYGVGIDPSDLHRDVLR